MRKQVHHFPEFFQHTQCDIFSLLVFNLYLQSLEYLIHGGHCRIKVQNINPLSANPTKWSSTQTICRQKLWLTHVVREN